jgi:hypothetical protein
MASPKRKRVNPARKYEREFIPISVHRATSAAAKAAGFWAAGALTQASIAYLRVTPSTVWRTVKEAAAVTAAARPKGASPAPTPGLSLTE